ncbi:MAG: aminotransferase [Gammaproteobacteria bacterium RIFCSPHIGHO2_02_FULL_42_13]|nr:MAG: aminotransferase [Gammaproteobacteria bacterium RIFCSPHIGHO2_02_FULL_42_13]
MMIRLSKSVVGEREVIALSKVMAHGYLGMGAEVQLLEQKLQDYLGCSDRKVVCVNSGTAALHLALQALGVGAGDEVLVPAMTYVASFQAISATGATPVACDVHLENGLLDLKDAEKRLSSKTKALMFVHYASYCGDLQSVYDFAKQHKLRVVEDAAHAFGSVYRGKKIGSFGDVVCFSFDGIKNITCGEGGAIVSADSAVIHKVSNARLLGVHRETEKLSSAQCGCDFDVMEQGFRYHMSNLMAAIGVVQLDRFEKEFKSARRQLISYYYERLKNIQGVQLLQMDLDDIVPHIMPMRVLNGQRDRLGIYLKQHAVEVGVHYKASHLLSKYGHGSSQLPVAEQLSVELLTLPLHPELSRRDIDYIVGLVQILLCEECVMSEN